MVLDRMRRAMRPRTAAAALIPSLAALMLVAAVAGSAGRPKPTTEPAEPAQPPAPEVRDTRANLEAAFVGEMDAKERYTTFAKQAALDGYPEAACVFRACAEAEAAHGRRMVQAIAWVGGEARAVLGKVDLRTTAENLQSAIDAEGYESTILYPALIARARAEHQTQAVRSLVFALSAEREHQRLLTAALASLDQRPAAHPLYVCPSCGKTVESLDFKKCPNCYTKAAKFTRIAS